MGTKVHCESYLPGYNPMRGHDEDRTGSWSTFYDGTSLNKHLYNDFILKPVHRYSEYDKEMLKQTMLEHEAIFRKQVYELHRVYKIQKILMDELKRKELYRYSVQMDTSQTSQANSFSSQVPLDNTKKILHTTPLPTGNTCYSRGSSTGLDNVRHPLNFLKENQNSVQSARSSVENGCSSKDCEILESRSNRLPRRMIDLQLPADVYVNNQEIERSERGYFADSSFQTVGFLHKNSSKEPENDVVLTLGIGEHSVHKEDSRGSYLHPKNGLSVCSLAGLNVPKKESFFERASGSTSNYPFGLRTHHADVQENNTTMTSFGLQTESARERQRDEGASSNFVQADMEDLRWELPFVRNDSGQSQQIHGSTNSLGPDLDNEMPTMFPEVVEVKQNITHRSLSSDQNKMKPWFKQKQSDSSDLSCRNSYIAVLNKPVMADPPTPDMFLLMQSNHYSAAFSPGKQHRITHVPVTNQALPGYNTSAPMNLQRRNGTMHIGDLRSNLKAGSESFSFQNDLYRNHSQDSNSMLHLNSPSIISKKPNHNSTSNSSAFANLESYRPLKCFKGSHHDDVKSGKNLNLNEAFSGGMQEDLEERSHEGLSWLRNKPCDDNVSSHSFSQLLSSISAVASDFERKTNKDKALCVSNLQDFQPTVVPKESSMQRNDSAASFSCKRILGFPILEKIQQTAMCSSSVSHQLEPSMDDTEQNATKVMHYSAEQVPSLDNHLSSSSKRDSGSNSASPRCHINLNSSIACFEDPNLQTSKVVLDINLEAPVSCQMEDETIAPPESSVIRYTTLPGQTAVSRVGNSKGTDTLQEIYIREAAEIIVAMSLDKCHHDIFQRPALDSCDTLICFAEVVLSNAAKEEGPFPISKSLEDNELDLFEAMTLKLRETKVDEYLCQPCDTVMHAEGNGAASLLLMKPRKGQARKRRQQRDFQKDILPGLVSLARHEVTEDLQVIGGLMRALGKSWQSSLTGKNTCRKTQTQVRRKRQPRSLPEPTLEIHTIPPVVKPINPELEMDGRSIIGWRRTTRQCRRSRCTLV